MKILYRTGLLVITLLVMICAPGCSAIKYIYGDSFHQSRVKPRNTLFHGHKSILKKKILLAPLINMAGDEYKKADSFTETLETLLKEDSSLLITSLTGYESPEISVSSDVGVIVDPELIKKAEEGGLNILVTQVLGPLNYTAKKRGIWPFRKLKGFYDVLMVINAVDVTDGTIVLSLKETERINIGLVPEGQETPPPLKEEILNEVLYDIQKSKSSELLDFLDNYGWRGKISMTEDGVRINGGKDIGVTIGSTFEVFRKGEPVKSLTGEIFYIGGPKAGEIRVTDVMEDHSFAVPLGENSFEDGQTITLISE